MFPKLPNAAPSVTSRLSASDVKSKLKKLTQQVIITLQRLRWPVIFITVKNRSALRSIPVLLLQIFSSPSLSLNEFVRKMSYVPPVLSVGWTFLQPQ